MEDYVLMLKDITDGEEVEFKKGKKYLILDEDEHNVYVSIKNSKIKCSAFDKKYLNKVFKYE